MKIELSADAATESARALTEELEKLNRRITGLQEEADRCGMFQHIAGWKAPYLTALQDLAKARTDHHTLVLHLDIARRREDVVLARLRYEAKRAKSEMAAQS